MSVKLRRKKLPGGKISLYLDIYHNGKRDYEFLKLYLTGDRMNNKEVLQLAGNIRAKRELELQFSEHGFIPHFKKKANFVEYVERQAKSKSPGESAWFSALKQLKAFGGDHIPFASVNETWLEEFKAYLLSRLSPNSAHTYFSKVKAALKQAVRDKIITRDPGQYVDNIKQQDIEKSFLSLEEMQALGRTPCADPEVKRAFLFSCYTGLRLSDVERITWGNVHNGLIEFRQKKIKGYEYLPLSEMAKKLLYSDYTAEATNILPLPAKRIFELPNRMQITRILRSWTGEAGITKRVTFHTARHTFATQALTYGAELYTVSKLLGHRNIKSTQIYARIVDQKKKEAVNLLPEIEVK